MAKTVFGMNNFPIFVAMKVICHILFGFAAILFLPCVAMAQNVGEWQDPCDGSVAGKSLRQAGIMYARPYQPRSHIGKMYYTLNLTCIDYIPINVRNLSTRRNDTIFSYNIYYFSGNVDSIILRGVDVRICKNKWIGYNNDGSYTISSWKKTKPSKTYLQYNDSIFKAECEVISIRWDQYSSTGILKTSKRTFLGIKWYKTY